MVIAFSWRIRFEDEVFGPALRVQCLYPAAVYMPPEAVWEYLDANGDWIEYLRIDQWRALLKKIRKVYNPLQRGSRTEVSTEERYKTLTYLDVHKKLSADRVAYNKVLAGLRNARNMKIHPYNFWIRHNPGDQQLWEQKARESVDTGLRALQEACPDGRLTQEWKDGKVWKSARVRRREREEWRARSGRNHLGRKE